MMRKIWHKPGDTADSDGIDRSRRRLSQDELPVWERVGHNPHGHEHQGIGGRHVLTSWCDSDGQYYAVCHTELYDESAGFDLLQTDVHGPEGEREWVKTMALTTYCELLKTRAHATTKDYEAVMKKMGEAWRTPT